jgi:thiol-disulfide isomerase/thioredoxin
MAEIAEMADTTSESVTTQPSSRARQFFREWGPQILIMALVFVGMRAWQLRGAAEGTAPVLVGRSIHDPATMLSVEDLKGRPAVVYFWATWCGVCDHVDPNVAAVARDHQVLTVAVNSGSSDSIVAWMAERGLTMPTISDPAGRLSRAYGVAAFPTTFWLDANGEIQHREVGYTSTFGLRTRLWLAD